MSLGSPHPVTSAPKQESVVSLTSTWGLGGAPLLLIVVTALAKTPYPLIGDPAGSFWFVWLLGSLAGVAVAALVLKRAGAASARQLPGAPVQTTRTGTLLVWVLTAVLMLAWVALYAVDPHAAPLLVRAATLLVALASAGLVATWIGLSPAVQPAATFTELSLALMGAFILFTLMSLLQQPLVASYAYPPVAGALLALCLRTKGDASKEAGSDEDELPPHALRQDVPAVAATLALCAVLGAGLPIVGGVAPAPGMFCALGIGSIVLAASLIPAIPGERVSVLVGCCLALVGACLSIVLDGSGAPLALMLAGGGVLLAWTLARVRASKVAIALGSSTRFLVLAGVAALVGFVIGRAVTTSLALGPQVQGVLLAVTFCIALSIWLGIVGPTVMSADVSVSSPADSDGHAAHDASYGAVLLATTYGLSPREAEIALLLYENRSVREVCDELHVAISTVKTHVAHVYEKAGVHSKSELQELIARLMSETDSASQ